MGLVLRLWRREADDLLAALLASGREILADRMRREGDQDSSLEEKLAGFLRVCVSRVDANRELFLAVAGLRLHSLQPSTQAGELGAAIRDFDGELMRILTNARARGALSSSGMSNARESFATLVIGAMTSRALQKDRRPVREVAGLLARFAVKGLRG